MPSSTVVEKPKLKVEIWPPTKIKYAYLEKNYYSTCGDLGSSCMRYKEMQRALNFYVKNNIRIVVIVDENTKIHARALLFDNVKSAKNKSDSKVIYTYLNRIYSNTTSINYLICDLANKNKWKHYYGRSSDIHKSHYYIENITIKDIVHLPYTDKFKTLYYKEGVLRMSYDPSHINCTNNISLTSTHDKGYHRELDPNSVREVLTGAYLSKKDCIKVKRYDGYVSKSNIANIDGDYYSTKDKVVFKSDLDDWILEKNKIEEVVTNETMNKNKATKVKRYNGYIHNSNLISLNDTTYHKKDKDIVKYKKKWYHISQCGINYTYKDVNDKNLLWHDINDGNKDNRVAKREELIIPYKHAIIVYNLKKNTTTNEIEYQGRYYPKDFKKFIVLNTGEYIINSPANKEFLKKFNGKYCIKQLFEPPNKHQLTFNFKEAL